MPYYIQFKFVNRDILRTIYFAIFDAYIQKKSTYVLKHTLNLSLNIVHLCGCFMEDKLIIK